MDGRSSGGSSGAWERTEKRSQKIAGMAGALGGVTAQGLGDDEVEEHSFREDDGMAHAQTPAAPTTFFSPLQLSNEATEPDAVGALRVQVPQASRGVSNVTDPTPSPVRHWGLPLSQSQSQSPTISGTTASASIQGTPTVHLSRLLGRLRLDSPAEQPPSPSALHSPLVAPQARHVAAPSSGPPSRNVGVRVAGGVYSLEAPPRGLLGADAQTLRDISHVLRCLAASHALTHVLFREWELPPELFMLPPVCLARNNTNRHFHGLVTHMRALRRAGARYASAGADASSIDSSVPQLNDLGAIRAHTMLAATAAALGGAVGFMTSRREWELEYTSVARGTFYRTARKDEEEEEESPAAAAPPVAAAGEGREGRGGGEGPASAPSPRSRPAGPLLGRATGLWSAFNKGSGGAGGKARKGSRAAGSALMRMISRRGHKRAQPTPSGRREEQEAAEEGVDVEGSATKRLVRRPPSVSEQQKQHVRQLADAGVKLIEREAAKRRRGLVVNPLLEPWLRDLGGRSVAVLQARARAYVAFVGPNGKEPPLDEHVTTTEVMELARQNARAAVGMPNLEAVRFVDLCSPDDWAALAQARPRRGGLSVLERERAWLLQIDNLGKMMTRGRCTRKQCEQKAWRAASEDGTLSSWSRYLAWRRRVGVLETGRLPVYGVPSRNHDGFLFCPFHGEAVEVDPGQNPTSHRTEDDSGMLVDEGERIAPMTVFSRAYMYKYGHQGSLDGKLTGAGAGAGTHRFNQTAASTAVRRFGAELIRVKREEQSKTNGNKDAWVAYLWGVPTMSPLEQDLHTWLHRALRNRKKGAMTPEAARLWERQWAHAHWIVCEALARAHFYSCAPPWGIREKAAQEYQARQKRARQRRSLQTLQKRVSKAERKAIEVWKAFWEDEQEPIPEGQQEDEGEDALPSDVLQVRERLETPEARAALTMRGLSDFQRLQLAGLLQLARRYTFIKFRCRPDRMAEYLKVPLVDTLKALTSGGALAKELRTENPEETRGPLRDAEELWTSSEGSSDDEDGDEDGEEREGDGEGENGDEEDEDEDEEEARGRPVAKRGPGLLWPNYKADRFMTAFPIALELFDQLLHRGFEPHFLLDPDRSGANPVVTTRQVRQGDDEEEGGGRVSMADDDAEGANEEEGGGEERDDNEALLEAGNALTPGARATWLRMVRSQLGRLRWPRLGQQSHVLEDAATPAGELLRQSQARAFALHRALNTTLYGNVVGTQDVKEELAGVEASAGSLRPEVPLANAAQWLTRDYLDKHSRALSFVSMDRVRQKTMRSRYLDLSGGGGGGGSRQGRGGRAVRARSQRRAADESLAQWVRRELGLSSAEAFAAHEYLGRFHMPPAFFNRLPAGVALPGVGDVLLTRSAPSDCLLGPGRDETEPPGVVGLEQAPGMLQLLGSLEAIRHAQATFRERVRGMADAYRALWAPAVAVRDRLRHVAARTHLLALQTQLLCSTAFKEAMEESERASRYLGFCFGRVGEAMAVSNLSPGEQERARFALARATLVLPAVVWVGARRVAFRLAALGDAVEEGLGLRRDALPLFALLRTLRRLPMLAARAFARKHDDPPWTRGPLPERHLETALAAFEVRCVAAAEACGVVADTAAGGRVFLFSRAAFGPPSGRSEGLEYSPWGAAPSHLALMLGIPPEFIAERTLRRMVVLVPRCVVAPQEEGGDGGAIQMLAPREVPYEVFYRALVEEHKKARTAQFEQVWAGPRDRLVGGPFARPEYVRAAAARLGPWTEHVQAQFGVDVRAVLRGALFGSGSLPFPEGRLWEEGGQARSDLVDALILAHCCCQLPGTDPLSPRVGSAGATTPLHDSLCSFAHSCRELLEAPARELVGALGDGHARLLWERLDPEAPVAALGGAERAAAQKASRWESTRLWIQGALAAVLSDGGGVGLSPPDPVHVFEWE